MYRTRYAPSPTGAMHLGHARTALLAWLRARSLGGRIVMRIEDLDPPRVKPGAAEAILRDHTWLGLDWDEGPVYQSARTEAYEEALAQLARDGRIYPCTCTRKEIEAALSSAPHVGDPGGELVYPGTCRPAGLGMQRAPHGPNARPNRPAALRFALREEDAAFERFVDMVQGPVTAPLGGDFVVRRSDGLFAYQLAVVVDDAAQGITEVLRGDDLLGSTPRQLALYAALGCEAPAFGHLGLVLADEGGRLSKRLGSVGIADYVARGVPKERILGFLGGSMGLCGEGESATLDELLGRFEMERVPRGAVRAPAVF
ncbi:MAG: tRNA glutamyl-Q(34) synthetase GluQRS [Sandaracinaceae bacterium]|nr:tRNA glutamyl-Q(34) synthetase GluQRS [Sandaracinaceae bacterium]